MSISTSRFLQIRVIILSVTFQMIWVQILDYISGWQPRPCHVACCHDSSNPRQFFRILEYMQYGNMQHPAVLVLVRWFSLNHFMSHPLVPFQIFGSIYDPRTSLTHPESICIDDLTCAHVKKDIEVRRIHLSHLNLVISCRSKRRCILDTGLTLG